MVNKEKGGKKTPRSDEGAYIVAAAIIGTGLDRWCIFQDVQFSLAFLDHLDCEFEDAQDIVQLDRRLE